MSTSTEITFQKIDYVKHRLVAEGILSFSSVRENEQGKFIPYAKETPFTVQENERGGYVIESLSEEPFSNIEEDLILFSLREKTTYNEDGFYG